jgi:hypothetical protein
MRFDDALARIRASVDPCGDSSEVTAIAGRMPAGHPGRIPERIR